MNNTINKLLITDSHVEFEGFQEITDLATFCFYPTGIVIMSELPKQKKKCHTSVKLNNSRRVFEKKIVQNLLQRGLTNEAIFVQHSTSYYELTPHEEK